MRDLHGCLTPVYYYAKIFGVISYSVSGEKRKRVFTRSIKSLILGVINVFSSIFNHVIFSKFLILDDKSYDYNVTLVLVLIILCLSVTSLVIVWCNIRYREKQIYILNKLQNIDCKMTKLGIFSDFRKSYRSMIKFMLYDFVSVIVWIILCFYTNENLPLMIRMYCAAAYVLHLFVTSTTFIYFEILLLCLKDMYTALHTSILKDFPIISCTTRSIYDEIITKIEMHTELYLVIRAVNEMYSVPILLQITDITLILIFHIYNIFYNAWFSNDKSSLINIDQMSNSLYWLIYYCGSAHILVKTCANVCEVVGTILHINQFSFFKFYARFICLILKTNI